MLRFSDVLKIKELWSVGYGSMGCDDKMSGILDVMKMSDLFEFLIYTDEFLVSLLIVLKKY